MHLERRPSILLSCFLLLCTLLFSQTSLAGRVVKVKGKKVYIKLDANETESVQQGDQLYLATPQGKKRALVIVRKLKGDKVLAQLKKGKAQKGLVTKGKSGGARPQPKEDVGYEDASTMAQREEDNKGRPDLLFGILGAFGSAGQDVTTNGTTFNTTGSSMAVKGLLDYSLFDDLGIRARVGLEMFNVSGSDNVGTNVTTEITYLSIDMMLRYFVYNSSSFGIFLNAGMGIYSPMSKSSGALDPESISTTSILIFGGGVSLPLNGWELFAGADYFYFPPSEDVKTSVISAKVGILFEL